MKNFKRTENRISEIVTERENKAYKGIMAMGRVLLSNTDYIEEQQWKAFHMNAPLDTCRFEGDEPIIFNELDTNWQTALIEKMPSLRA